MDLINDLKWIEGSIFCLTHGIIVRKLHLKSFPQLFEMSDQSSTVCQYRQKHNSLH